MWFNFSSLCLQPKWATIRLLDIAPPRFLTEWQRHHRGLQWEENKANRDCEAVYVRFRWARYEPTSAFQSVRKINETQVTLLASNIRHTIYNVLCIIAYISQLSIGIRKKQTTTTTTKSLSCFQRFHLLTLLDLCWRRFLLLLVSTLKLRNMSSAVTFELISWCIDEYCFEMENDSESIFDMIKS